MTNFKTLFETKENYLNFRAAWKESFNTPKEDSKSKHAHMLPVHFLVYNVLRNKPAHNGFTPITNHNKLACSAMHPTEGFKYAVGYLSVLAKYTENPDKKTWRGEIKGEIVDNFLKPFGGIVTREMLVIVANHVKEHYDDMVDEIKRKGNTHA